MNIFVSLIDYDYRYYTSFKVFYSSSLFSSSTLPYNVYKFKCFFVDLIPDLYFIKVVPEVKVNLNLVLMNFLTYYPRFLVIFLNLIIVLLRIFLLNVGVVIYLFFLPLNFVFFFILWFIKDLYRILYNYFEVINWYFNTTVYLISLFNFFISYLLNVN